MNSTDFNPAPSAAAADDAALRRRAKKRVEAKMGWYIHALVYVLVNGGLLLVNLVAGGHRWSVWPLLGWGIGLAVHGIVVFAAYGPGERWRERMLAQELQRLRDESRPGGGR